MPITVEDERGKVSKWRFDICEKMGFDRDDAFVLAERHDIPLHDIIELVELKGCPPRQAFLILL